MKTAELIGPALDWAVAKGEGIRVQYQPGFLTYSDIQMLADWDDALEYTPSTDWAQGGPIIERECIELERQDYWKAKMCFQKVPRDEDGPAPLVAAMRCYVASKLGDEVDIPEELK